MKLLCKNERKGLNNRLFIIIILTRAVSFSRFTENAGDSLALKVIRACFAILCMVLILNFQSLQSSHFKHPRSERHTNRGPPSVQQNIIPYRHLKRLPSSIYISGISTSEFQRTNNLILRTLNPRDFDKFKDCCYLVNPSFSINEWFAHGSKNITKALCSLYPFIEYPT